MDEPGVVVVVAGPTASGKSALALQLCRILSGTLINCDALQMYAAAPIATNQPSPAEVAEVPHRLVSFLDPRSQMSVRDFVRLADAAVAEAAAAGRVPVVVGGTVYYLLALLEEGHALPEGDGSVSVPASHVERRAMLERLDAASAAAICARDERKTLRALQICLAAGRPRSELLAAQSRRRRYANVRVVRLGAADEAVVVRRVEAMAARGLVAEHRDFRRTWVDEWGLAVDCEKGVWQAIGLKEFEGNDGAGGEAAALRRIVAATLRYARQQDKLLRRAVDAVFDHVSLPAGSEASEALCRWAMGRGDGDGLTVVPATGRAPRDEERLECCGKTMFGRQAVEQHLRSDGHRKRAKKAARLEKNV